MFCVMFQSDLFLHFDLVHFELILFRHEVGLDFNALRVCRRLVKTGLILIWFANINMEIRILCKTELVLITS